MRKIEQKEFCERYDARRTFYNCQVKVQQVSSKLETLLANSKIECRELYENQMEKITDAKKLADWIRDTYMRVKKVRGVLYARACLTVMMADWLFSPRHASYTEERMCDNLVEVKTCHEKKRAALP